MPSSDKTSAIPVGTGFSPDLVSLPDYVLAAVEHSGDQDALENAVNAPPVWIGNKLRTTRRTRRHPMEAGAQYGLLTDGEYEATALAEQLAGIVEAERAKDGAPNYTGFYETFAKHILLKLGGLRVVEAAQEMELDRRNITGDTLAQYLTDQGFRVSVHNTAINTLRMWLAQAGLFPESGRSKNAWIADSAVKERLVGLDDDLIAALAGFEPELRAYLRALCRLEPDDWIAAADVRDFAEATFGVRFGRASLPSEVLAPLADAGLIEYDSGGTQRGKSSRLRTTDAFKADVLTRFLEYALKDLNAALTAYYRTRPADIFAELKSDDTYKKGHALEAFTVYVMRLLGLRFLGWRRRAKETGYSEVDVLMVGLFGAMPTTWQVQCKNTPSTTIRLEDIAKEVGLLPLTHATHILVVANSTFSEDARRFAQETMLASSVTIFLLDEDDFETIRDTPARLGGILLRQANRIRDLRLAAKLWSGIERPEDDAGQEESS
ncbi:MAG: restriction endonuclease [Bacteroidota bacterium]